MCVCVGKHTNEWFLKELSIVLIPSFCMHSWLLMI